tara:strand:- start:146 stop:562 length:417 start_codon:yes stop_codon:yes gene_type:complete
MGYKLSIILGGLLVISLSGSVWYINYLQDQIATLKGNQLILETEIEQQNADIKKLLSDQQILQTNINSLEKDKQESEREVNRLRETFARHDLDNLALQKPGLIQTRVNKGTKRVKDTLIALTDPNQFDEDEESINPSD